MTGELSLLEKLKRKAIGLAGRAYFIAARLLYRAHRPWGGKLGQVDHLTVPTTDLAVAEAFYCGVLGARIVLRIDRPMLKRLGWPDDEIERNHAVNLSITWGGGPRLDLFEYPLGLPSEAAIHPHIALSVAPGRMRQWKTRLIDRGVVVVGPTRAGPPGQASLYFNDPFGNHLELVTIGYVDEDLAVGIPDRTKLNYVWRRQPA
jgi:catechol 2,3-dioxygenase-like lactoylglutathione lyase family enzyme